MPFIQDYPAADSYPTDPLEGLVAIYFQLRGFLTSSNKWFWVREDGKRQRGYQDIDVLAVSRTETIIVSVTSNLDDKVRHDRSKQFRQDMFDQLNQHFDRVEAYLRAVPAYSWLVQPERDVRRVVAYASGDSLAKRLLEAQHLPRIELLSASQIIDDMRRNVAEHMKEGMKTNSQLIKLIQLFSQYVAKG